jgi:Uracil DNA glycosylase superfamily
VPPSSRRVFDFVSRCENVRFCLETSEPHPCRKIVEYQVRECGVRIYDEFQLPEPWVGEIDLAPILLVASNPSIGEDEHACAVTDDEVWESHHLAHGGGRRPYIVDGIYTTRPDGRANKRVRYWMGARARATELIPDRPVIPGRDYAMTEIVHCKSPKEYGAAEAEATCADRHMERIMAVSAARVVIAVGAFAWRWFLKRGGDPPPSPLAQVIGGRPRLLVFTPHFSPNRKGPQRLSLRYSAASMKMLQAAIHAVPGRETAPP